MIPGPWNSVCQTTNWSPPGDYWRLKHHATRRELESLLGHLGHACKVVRPGRRFLRGILRLISGVRDRDRPIRLNSHFWADGGSHSWHHGMGCLSSQRTWLAPPIRSCGWMHLVPGVVGHSGTVGGSRSAGSSVQCSHHSPLR